MTLRTSTIFPPQPARSRCSPVRTRFSILLQLNRCFPVLLSLVRAGYEGDLPAVRTASTELATDVLRCSRDRSRDRHLRPLLDQQRRTDSLTKPRLRTKKAA
jgi:hypothetical protein